MSMISIIVPTYNIENYIEKCLHSLIKQSYSDIEIIVIDDGSTDKTPSIVKGLKKIDNRIKIFEQSNRGAACARNRGLELASGEFITFVDGDDMLSTTAVEDNIKYLHKDNNLDWVAFSIVRTDSAGNPINNSGIYSSKIIFKDKILTANDFVPAFYNGELSGVCCGAIYRRTSISDIKFPEGRFYEDGFFFTDLLSMTSKGLLSKKGKYLYVHRPDSSQLIKLDKQHLLSDFECSTKRLSQYRIRFPQYENIYRIWENRLYYYYKNEMAKKTEGADEIFTSFISFMKHKPEYDLKKEVKFLIYKTIGYKNISKFLNFFK